MLKDWQLTDWQPTDCKWLNSLVKRTTVPRGEYRLNVNKNEIANKHNSENPDSALFDAYSMNRDQDLQMFCLKLNKSESEWNAVNLTTIFLQWTLLITPYVHVDVTKQPTIF